MHNIHCMRTCLLALVITLWCVKSARAVDILPGTSIQSVVNANPAGTTYLLKAGIHRMQSITPKTGDTFVGESGTILNGSRLLSSFTLQGVLWFLANQTQQGSTNGSCQSGHGGCIYPEDLYLNDVPLLHV